MATVLNRLSALKVRNAKPGLHADGGGLYLQVSSTLTSSWIFRFSFDGRLREMGLGSTKVLTLGEARVAADKCRKLRLGGLDPIEERNKIRNQLTRSSKNRITFDECRDKYVETNSIKWRSEKHRQQWTSTLVTYCSPIFGNLPVEEVTVDLVLQALEPIWRTKTETAGRVRARIEKILGWATTRQYRNGDNPARWTGHLENVLPERALFQQVNHHPALPYVALFKFMIELQSRVGTSARALEFAILCASRTGEVIGAKWDEVNLATATWTIPGSRMKGGKEHRVPLSARAVDILRDQIKLGSSGAVFKNIRGGHLSNMALLAVLKRMGRSDITTHGFRATFATWAADSTTFPREVIESSLAHVFGSKVELAYQRSDHLDRRRELMNRWSDFCTNDALSNVVPLRA